MSSFQTLLSISTHQPQLYFPNASHLNVANLSKRSFIHRPLESLQKIRFPNYKYFKSNIRTLAQTNLEGLFNGKAAQENTLVGGLVESEPASNYSNNGSMSTFNDMSLIDLESMKQANPTIEDFFGSYYMFHGLDLTKIEYIFKYMPLLSYVEGYIYKMDNLNEKVIDAIRSKRAAGNERRSIEEGYSISLDKAQDILDSDPFGPLKLQLERDGLLTERLSQQFEHGAQYWALERKICATPSEQISISIEQVLSGIHFKSFDYKALNLLLYQLEGKEINELHMEFLSVCEFLWEISDDLFDYEDNVLENTFNTLRLFVRIYGPSAGPTMLAKCIADAEEKYKELGKALDPELYKKYQIRIREAAHTGGDKLYGYPLGSWTIPPVIADEDKYRSSKLNCP